MRTILLVEDEFGIAAALSDLLEDEGYRVLVAANGRQALERLAEIVPDLVVTDYMMPLMDGVSLGMELKQNPAWSHIPIVIMSAVPESALRQRFTGYTAFLQKPFPVPAIIDLAQSILPEE